MSASDDSSAACRVSTTQASLDDRPETVQEGPGNNGTDGLQILSSGGAGTRMILTAEDARTIYQVKRRGKGHHDAASLGKRYSITAKAVRDVWRHRTWAYATMCFWTPAEVNTFARRKMCADCREAGVSMESSKQACTKCKKIVRRLMSHRAGLRLNQGASATAGLAAELHDSWHESGDCPTFAPLRTLGWNQIWSRQNGLHDGLLQEALEFI